MAILKEIHCSLCCEVKVEARANNDYSTYCRECQNKIKICHKKLFMETKESMSILDRVRILEDFMYEHGRQFHPREILF